MNTSIISEAHPTKSPMSNSEIHSMHPMLSTNASVIQSTGTVRAGKQPIPAAVMSATHMAQSAQNYNERILIVFF